MKNIIITSIIALTLTAAGPAVAKEKKAKTAEAQPTVAAHYQESTPKPDKKVEKAKKRVHRTDQTRDFWNQRFKFVSF